MGGDHAPDAIIGGALIAARRLGYRPAARRRARGDRGRAHPASRCGRRRRPDSSCARSHRDGRVGVGGAAAEAPGFDSRRGRGGQERGSRGALQRRPYRRGRHGRACRVRPAARRRSAGARDDHPDPTESGGAARLWRDRRMPAAAPRPVRRDGVGVCARSRSGASRRASACCRSGQEESKGNELTREAHQLLKSAPVRFVGNVEGRDVYSGEADVIVCDGFTGNVTLKISEGLVETVERLLHEELSATVGTRVGYLLSREAFRRFRKRVDYAEYGGAPLIGLDGLCVIGHGRSSAKAVRSAIMMTAKLVNERLLDRLAQEVAAVGSEPEQPTASRDPEPQDAEPPNRRTPNQHDRIRLPRPGCAESRHGQGPGRGVSHLPADIRRGRRGARRVAEPALLRGPRVATAPHREHAAGNPRRQRGRLLGWLCRAV